MHIRTPLRAACSSFQAATTPGNRHIHLYIYLDYIDICTHTKYTHTHIFSHSAVCKYMDVRTSLRAACSSFQAAITSGSRHIHLYIYLDYIHICTHIKYTHTHTHVHIVPYVSTWMYAPLCGRPARASRPQSPRVADIYIHSSI